jgi:hypothetical protein
VWTQLPKHVTNALPSNETTGTTNNCSSSVIGDFGQCGLQTPLANALTYADKMLIAGDKGCPSRSTPAASATGATIGRVVLGTSGRIAGTMPVQHTAHD